MTKQNILIFGHSYATQFIDINNQYTRLFDPEHFNVTVVYLTGIADDSITQRHLASEVIFLNLSKSTARGIKLGAIWKLLMLHRKKNFHIVICHRYKPSYVMFCVNLFKKIPHLFSVMHELGTMKSIMRNIVTILLAPKSLFFAGVSDAVRDDLRKALWKFPMERVITLYNMIDVEQTEHALLSRTAARHELHLSEDDFIFGSSGRLVPNKDQKTLLRAFAIIQPRCPNAKLIIMGDGHLERELKALALELNIQQSVIFTGFIQQGFRFLKAFDVYLSSSIQEAFGRVLLEAMVARIPIIATAVNGVPEVIGDAGILVPATNAVLMAQAMMQLYSTEEKRRALGEQGYQRARNSFSLQTFNDIFWRLPIHETCLHHHV